MYEYLDRIRRTGDIKKLKKEELDGLAADIRDFLIRNVAFTGGHLASNLGVVELTIALHYVFNPEEDKIVWDVGHQSYVHKILTGRKDSFNTLRKTGGLSGFPKYEESPTDVFNTGHSSTSISAAMGLARARDLDHEKYNVVAVIGDASISGGMAFEAINDAGFARNRMLVVLNDNKMSISESVGGLSKYLNRLRSQPAYFNFKHDTEIFIRKIPLIGTRLMHFLKRLKRFFKKLLLPGLLFEELGLEYFGPIDGHDIKELIKYLSRIKRVDGPVILHTLTLKGKGYGYAEERPSTFHGISPFEIETGEPRKCGECSFSERFGLKLEEIAAADPNVVAITAGMQSGTGLEGFASRFPERFFDVGIAEQHALTMACGLARGGKKPVFAIYSTFLQRAYDQVLHDMCAQNLHVVLGVDRAGLVGEDGETHQGLYDIAFLRHIPNMTILAPADFDELDRMIEYAFLIHNGPIAIRYPRGKSTLELNALAEPVEYCRSKTVLKGTDVTFVAAGIMLETAIETAELLLKKYGRSAEIIDARFLKPLDVTAIRMAAAGTRRIVTFEDGTLQGGFGSAVLEMLNAERSDAHVKMIGYPDKFIRHGSKQDIAAIFGLDAASLCEEINAWLSADD